MSDEVKQLEIEAFEKMAKDVKSIQTKIKAFESKTNEPAEKLTETAEFKNYEKRMTEEFQKIDEKVNKIDGRIQELNRPAMSAKEKREEEYENFNVNAKYAGLLHFQNKGQNVKNLNLYKPEIEEKALAIGNNVRAGYLQAPAEFIAKILDQAKLEFSPIRRLASVLPLSGAANTVEIPAVTAHGVASWTGEAGTSSEDTTFTLGLEEIKLHKMTALYKSTIEMMDDSVFNLEAVLRDFYSAAFGKAEGTAFVSGSGIAKPEGILTNADVSSTNSGAAATWTADGFIELFFAIKEYYTTNAVWLMKRASIGVLAKLKGSDGQYLLGTLATLPGFILLGHPIIESIDMPTIAADSYSAIFGDFKQGYQIIDKTSRNLIVDPYSSKTTGIIEFLMEQRVGGKVVVAEAMRKLKTSA